MVPKSSQLGKNSSGHNSQDGKGLERYRLLAGSAQIRGKEKSIQIIWTCYNL